MKNENRKNWKLNTRLNHPERITPAGDNPPLLAPIYQSVKFVVSEETSYGNQYIYTRLSNPTLKQLEMLLADLQNKEECIVLSSGIAAISGAFLGLLQSGDHIITFRELYKPARIFIRDMLPKFGITASILKLTQLDELEKAIIPGKTKIIHFESPTNPNLEIADIERIIKIARKHNVLISMDGTFAGLHQHTDLDIDLMFQSLTKFGNGHGDVLAGSIAGKKSLIQKIRQMTIILGATLDPHAAFLVERGLKTYLLRFERHTKNAAKVADFLNQHPKVQKVFYPGLKDHPGHELAKKQMSDMGAIVSFVLDPNGQNADQFAHKLKLIQFAVSLGATESIICPTHLFFGDDLSAIDKQEMGINPYSLRLSVGLEDHEDLIADLKLALG
ncbi:MAG: PLP-dependent transferase [Bdellovibrionales bacterium]|nr:PLP-dependent transferase [Bdellovibrionales bacterium]